jgi:tetratricopeptide (TPR) repeat protein
VGDYYDRSGSPSEGAMRAFLAGYGMTMLHLADVTQGADPLSQSASAFEQAIQHTDRKSAPLDWASSQSNLGMVLQTLGVLKRDPDTLKQAVVALNAALEETTRDRSPLEWAAVQQELGVTLADLAQIDHGPDTVANLTAAVAAFSAAVEVQTRALVPRDWSKGQSGLGLALAARGIATKSTGDLRQALTALLAAREEQPSDKVPHDWAMTTRNIALIQKRLADIGDDPTAYDEPIENLKEAQDTLKQDTAPIDRAQTLVYLGDAAVARATRSHDAADLGLAHDAYTAAMPTYQQAGESYAAALKQKLHDVDKALKGR